MIKYNKVWKEVCSTYFNTEAGNIACSSAYGTGSVMESFDG